MKMTVKMVHFLSFSIKHNHGRARRTCMIDKLTSELTHRPTAINKIIIKKLSKKKQLKISYKRMIIHDYSPGLSERLNANAHRLLTYCVPIMQFNI